jgi:deoxyguanosinetriphosphate triphosphohydrolase, putative
MGGDVSKIFLEREKHSFSKYAFFTSDTRGRDHDYVPCRNRTEFQRDRDRIIHSKAFRRLTHKTQVFLLPTDEHYRTRMTHTLEVTQIARIIARALRLNEDLCEAIALGHDLGHTPFGHAGERAMQECWSPDFHHYKQSQRVVEYLENNGAGLNLTWEVRDGIVNHTGDNLASTLEGVIVKFADRIAYYNHDIDDACRAGIFNINDIPRSITDIIGKGHGERINAMVTSVIDASTDKPAISMTPKVADATQALREFLFENVYLNPKVKAEESKVTALLKSLFTHYEQHPKDMPEFFYQNTQNQPDPKHSICDYLSGMTDRFAIETYKQTFIPKVWEG